jgi:3-hydroxyisobutyrate dehydrogenase
MQVGYIGLGAMGGALARRLVGRFPLHILDLNRAVVEQFLHLGARDGNSPADIARACDIVLLCLPRSSDVRQVIFGPGGLAEGLAAGKIIVDQTSGVPEETRRMAADLADRGVTLFDAPVSGPMASVAAGTISIIASGPAAAFSRAQPVLQALSANVFRCGERVGGGQTMKSVNNMMNASCRLAMLELVALGRKMGVPLEALAQAINATAARSSPSTTMLPALIEGRQATRFGLPLMLKDVNQALSLGAAVDAPMPIGNATRALLQMGVNTVGDGSQLEDMVRVIESMAATRIVGAAA